MTAIQFSQLSYQHPNGEAVFQNLSESIATGLTVITGDNGIGKSLLLASLAGRRGGNIKGLISQQVECFYLGQHALDNAATVADVIQIRDKLAALKRIEQGKACEQDFELIGDDDWLLAERWQQRLASQNIGLFDSLDQLSGGQRTRLVIKLLKQTSQFLLLDEPSNHLDQANRVWLAEALASHQPGVLAISHDPILLDAAQRIIHFDHQGLHSYSGGFAAYRENRQRQLAGVQAKIETIERQQKQIAKQHQLARERAEQRQKQGKKLVRDGSQSKMLGDFKADKASKNQGNREQAFARLQQQLETEKPASQQAHVNRLHANQAHYHDYCMLQNVILPYGRQQPISLSIRTGDRLWLAGPNGSGKSTLLKVLTGQLEAISGELRRPKQLVYVDQQVSLLEPTSTAKQFLAQFTPELSQTDRQTLLAGIGLRRDRADLLVGQLSGGERMKLALAYASQTSAVLLLDEPDNHLDLQSQSDLAHLINQLANAVVVVSHNKDFVNQIDGLKILSLA
ncbi:ATP-binding cassette domain-containing protein [Salinibius halmophilus]|uniref:ATP-binding cassette domain-containing protein n=1 Tax=Salinibius halmophilus TaxID=1853216 RepID=UPI000E66EDB8|nr:ATP-binding cassette domain-containing protein [Salinibius halmophilus]